MLRNILGITIFIFTASVFTQSAESSLYKWKDAEGNTHFSDKLPDNVKAEPLLSISGTKFVPRESYPERSVAAQPKSSKESYYCRQYKKKINKISIYLKHTPNDLDKQKVKDLKQQLKLECRNGVYRKSYKNNDCRRHAQKLNKYIIYNKHTPTDRDEQAIKDLQMQIKLECR